MTFAVQTPSMALGWWLVAGVILTPIWSAIEFRRGHSEKASLIWKNSIPFLPTAIFFMTVSIFKYRTIGALEALTVIATIGIVCTGLVRTKSSRTKPVAFTDYLFQEGKQIAKRPLNWVTLVIFWGVILAA